MARRNPSPSASPGVRVPVLQLVDVLTHGGGQRVAVDIANALPRERWESHLCATRGSGPLRDEVLADVGVLLLDRKRRSDDVRAVLELVRYVRRHRIRLLHCHMNTVFLASLAARFAPHPRLVWHDHYGDYAIAERPAWLYRIPMRRVDGVIAVNEPLRDWSVSRLGVPADRVWYLQNFVNPRAPRGSEPDLPGEPGARVVCVANLRPMKDQVNLVRAMSRVVERVPQAHALLVGLFTEPEYRDRVAAEIETLGLRDRVHLLGGRDDVPDVLARCDVGVLSSASEGLPLALIEYGFQGLACVATRTGAAAEVLDEGDAGLLVPTRDPEALAGAIVELLQSAERRAHLGGALRRRVEERFGPDAAIARVEQVYERVLEDAGPTPS